MFAAFTSGDLFACKETPYTIRVINEVALIKNIIDGLVFCYCKTYPKMAARFNHRAPTGITLRIVQTLNVPAHTVASQALITANANYIKSHLSDIDFITHEGFHIIQSYPPTDQGWITEGLADYARYMYGVKNAEANWGLPALSSPADVMKGYTHAARFFVWIERRYRTDIRTLDQAMRSQSYTSQIWVNMTNRSLVQLLEQYATDSSI